ncbi:hypothetical protein EVAR_90734_1 [Eumeta japonica]|uniref:Uncharacterized protein n=1 Tax=Eumeta variegata TaxID=151549 RepID=A0A4C1ZXL6_EUMVA|nr:hypothetical protein EVAR_90734_1 [Eumeta japonica]
MWDEISGKTKSQKRQPSNFFLRRSRLDLARILERSLQDRSEARSEEQKDESNALGLECGLARCVGVLLFRMKRSSLSIMSTKFLPAESTPSEPQRDVTGNRHGSVPFLLAGQERSAAAGWSKGYRSMT